MPFVDLADPSLNYLGMQLNDTAEQAAELCTGFRDAGNAGLLVYARPHGYYEGDPGVGSWHISYHLQLAQNFIPFGNEITLSPGDWIIIGMDANGAVREILPMTDADRISRGFNTL